MVNFGIPIDIRRIHPVVFLLAMIAGLAPRVTAQTCLDCSGTPPAVTDCTGDYSVCGRWVEIPDCPTPPGQSTPPWPNCWPVGVKAVHTVLTHTGRVLVFGRTLPGSDCFWNASGMAHLWHPGEFNVSSPQDNIMVYSSDQTNDRNDLFCSGHALLPDGKVIVVGGTDKVLSVGSDIWGTTTTFLLDAQATGHANCNRQDCCDPACAPCGP